MVGLARYKRARRTPRSLTGWQSLPLALVLYTCPAIAQIVPDVTLPDGERSQTIGTQTIEITGGAVRGGNLFHSFEQFSIPTGDTAWFNNASSITNIISRVTGTSASSIDGTLRANGSTNLFLINPNGIVFGRNARLSLGGSFVASTANAIQFGDRGVFSATTPTAPTLLTVNPSAFVFNQLQVGRIENRSQSGLQVPIDRSLLLVGGDMVMDDGDLLAPAGQVALVAIAGTGTIGLHVNQPDLKLEVPVMPLADISLTNGASIRTSGQRSGAVHIWGNQVTLSGSSGITAITLGAEKGGELTIVAETLTLVGSARRPTTITTQSQGAGDAGDLTITARDLRLLDGGLISTSTLGKGAGGKLVINAAESVQLINTISTLPFPSSLQSSSIGEGHTGELLINTQQLWLQGGGQILTGTLGTGQGGNITVHASESVQLQGNLARSSGRFKPSVISTSASGSGKAGDLTMTTRQLLLDDRSQLATETLNGSGGKLTLQAIDVIELSGSNISARSFGSGSAGAIELATDQLLLRDRSAITTDTFGQGIAGDVVVRANAIDVRKSQVSSSTASSQAAGDITLFVRDRVVLSGAESGLFANTARQSTGNGGTIFIDPKLVIVRDGAQISVDSQGTGRGGDIQIQAERLILDDRGAISAQTASSQGGNIALALREYLLLRRNSTISTTAGKDQAGGDGGNLFIRAPFLLSDAREDSDITANAFSGKGGNIRIAAAGIFGLQFRAAPSRLSDITASSTLGIDGVVQLDTLDLDPSQGLTELPTRLVDVAGLIDQTVCRVRDRAAASEARSEFVITGRGGLPSAPTDLLEAPATWEDWRIADTHSRPPTQSQLPTAAIVEAQGWTVAANGDVRLVVDAIAPTPLNSGFTHPSCQTRQ